jgi:hypothetical protein
MLTQNDIGFIARQTGNQFDAIRTEDDTATTISTVTLPRDNSGFLKPTVGFVEYTLLALDSTGLNGLTGRRIVRYLYDGTTLTLGTPSDIDAIVTEAGLSGADFDVSDDGENILITVTGLAATTIDWSATVQHWHTSVTLAL